MTRKEKRIIILKLCEACGLALDTWSPGDGITRYRFIEQNDESIDYFGCSDVYKLYTALGLHEAYTWVRGFKSGVLAERVTQTNVSNLGE